jgi:hypothetical protein
LNYFNGKKISPSHMTSNMDPVQKKKYLAQNGNDPDAAYRAFLNDITDRHVDVTRFMVDSKGISVPTAADLYSLAVKKRKAGRSAAVPGADGAEKTIRAAPARRTP